MSAAHISATPVTGSFSSGEVTDVREFHAAGVSWSAVAAGAFVTASFTLIIMSLGAGLGLSSFSSWSNAGSSGVGAAAIVWLIFNEIVSSAAGGYLAGRLRIKWATIHNDEVYFRDTAHGLLVWAVAVVLTVSFLAAAATSVLGAPGPVQTPAESNRYFVDTLFRADSSPKSVIDNGLRSEAGRILTYSLAQGDINAADRSYLQEMVMAQTGLNPADAQKRVSGVLAGAKLAMDQARKEAAHFLLWLFIALLIGAFSASLAATIGGRQRDHVQGI